ncbi:MAG: hypothetical protein IJH07_04720 [Ruminococcus sp.]|nr:hypothetical protein [Ruminococcus sp.]
MGRYDFKFGDTWISELGAVSTETPTIEIAQRDYELVKIPGKNGDDYIDNGRYENVPITRSISFVGRALFPVDEKVNNFINTYAYLQGYHTFEDTDHNDMVTEAVLLNFKEVNRKMRTLHSAKLKFSRKPYWFLKDGLKFQTVDLTTETPSLQFNNPFPAESEPIIKFGIFLDGNQSPATFSFRITTGGVSVVYTYDAVRSGITGDLSIWIDCEKRTVKMKSGAASSLLNISNIPKGFDVGSTLFEIMSGKSNLTEVLIAPRWRCL